ncbi:ubiquitin 3 binding protein But2 C-terminal domain-containing protein [Xylaria bambusicola]|uniref:ubiquitin 3 binding protein But2 C-terminal domain-containing protein n=1 Tax=Xylaria bambusicola TaxID=326684 RepID=UPI0020087214|nr:ubiquitin 3 binding protein But2 C-terminal domain-containing protein [Xylaria bambusicola]KAI0512960.1 ubiquitin 3 binding protein But2 C-terminal domain-containing protein [Xylaria bambusicola]
MLVMLIPLVSILWMHTLDPVDAHATRDNVGCGFHLSCSGAFNGSVGEKGSGQAHAGSDVSTPSLFTWFGDAFADQQGSGCWWTPPTFTLQCDKNQPPDHGFDIGCDGVLSFSGQSVFYECPTGEGDEVNLYLRPVGDQCHEVTIHADNCAPSTCPGGGGAGPVPGATNSPSTSATTMITAPSSPNSPPGSPSSGPATLSSSTTSPGPPTRTPFTTNGGTTKTSITSTSTITTIVPGSSSGTGSSTSTPPPGSTSSCVETGPEQIILTDLGNPDTAYGPNDGKHIQVSPNASSIFNFRFDDADVGKTCQISFRLTSSSASPHGGGGAFNLTGTGIVVFEALEGWANSNTTYNSMPRVVQTMDDAVLFDGLDRAFPAFPCPGSSTRSAVLLSEGPMADTCLDCVQGGGVGMFLRKC